MRAHPALLGLAAVAALSGCAATVGTTTGTMAVAKPAPSVKVSPSPMRVITIAIPKATSAPPTLRNTGTSWTPILTSLSAYGQWLLANPNPALVGTVATPGCAAANLLSDQIAGLLGSRTYVKTAPATITSVLGPSPAPASSLPLGTGSQVVLQVIASRPAEPVVSRANGKTISTFGAYPQSALEVTLNLGADKHWRLCSVEDTADAGATDDPSVPLI
ncbi:hypothetical protein ODJ79_41470 [Actinoplanes sp. KI2]|uniref:hypothetical protein n=1 Tax=Actinoplanes sp. KI2 TaxID=2983315 RepID=UPI0021D5902B|nr:hypothetical protein [Actinoplanes sp. KI2]MCU7730226.1 hypothetical protein [Actinoplanes sp. KI2]